MGLSKLQAVNIVLDAIGETPVSSLSSGLPDAESAEAKIDEISKSVQAKGWHQNTDYKLKLTPDTNNNILIPDTYLRVDTASSDRDTNVTVRKNGTQNMLYHIKNQNFTFPSYVWADVVHHLEFENLSRAFDVCGVSRCAEISRSADGFCRGRQLHHASRNGSVCRSNGCGDRERGFEHFNR